MRKARSDKRLAIRDTREAGQVVAWIVIALPLLLVLVGLVFDGGLLWAQFRRARWAADGAAVSAASEIAGGEFQERGRVELGDAAVSAANYYAQQNYPGLHVTAAYVQDGIVYVQARVEVQPVFLSMVGVDTVRFNVLGRARPYWGTEEQE
jgi:Flp pilus assembly protein TadG